MSSFKEFFNYVRGVGQCGISNVYFSGTRGDWEKVFTKLKNLKKYDVDGVLKKYVHHVGVIIQKFLETYDGKPDVSWWNNIMETEQAMQSSGGKDELYVEGWILHFFGLYTKCDITDIPLMPIEVPIKLKNEWTKQEKDLLLLADWTSVSKVDSCTYKPDIGMCIIGKDPKTNK